MESERSPSARLSGESAMTELVLDAEQTKILAEATGPVMVRDREGRELGVLFPSEESDDECVRRAPDEIRRRMQDDPSKFLTTPEVLARLKALDAQ